MRRVHSDRRISASWIGGLAGVALAALAGPAAAQSVHIFQDSFTWYGNNNAAPVVTPFSQWGSVLVDYQSGAGQNFLNVSVNGVWQASNIPLFQFGPAGQMNTVSYHFGLTDAEGPSGPVSFGFSITNAALASAPAETQMVTPLERMVGVSGGFGPDGAGPDMSPPPPPAPPPPTPPGPVEPVTMLGPDFHPQDYGLNQCGPAAILSNLDYLNQHGGNIPDSALTLGFISDQFGHYATDANGVRYFAGFDLSSFEEKKSYYGNYGIETEINISVARAIEIFRRGGVLELLASGGRDANGDPLDGHVVPVTGLSSFGNILTLTVADDENPGRPGGLIEEIIRINTATGRVNGPAWLTRRTAINFVGESNVPEPAAWALMLIGFGVLGAAARRGRRPRPLVP